MAPAKTAVRSRRTQSYSWSSDSIALRPGYQSPGDLNSSGSGASPPTPVTARRNIHKSGDPAAAIRAPSRSPSRSAFRPRINYDSDSCLTPRSRRTLRRTLSGVTEPWPGVDTISTAPSLDTIYSPTHEILHPMQSLLLEKSLVTNVSTKPLTTVSFVTVRTTSTGNHFTPTRTTQSVDFDNFHRSDRKRAQPKSSKVESYKLPEPRDEEDAPLHGESTESMHGSEVAAPAPAPAPSKNIVVIIMNAEKKPGSKFAALDWAMNVAVQPGDEIVILGVLKHVSSPSGHKVAAITDPVNGVKPELLQSDVQRIAKEFEQKLSQCGRRVGCEKKNVRLTVRIAAGARARAVVVRELAAVKATYAIFDRRVIRGTSYYNKHLSCHAVRMRSNGRSTKTIFTKTGTQKSNNNGSSSNFKNTSNTDNGLMKSRNPTTASAWESPTTSETGSGSSAAASPTHFWRRFTPFRSNRNKWSPVASSLSPRSSTASSDVASPSPTTTADVGSSLNLDSFMSEMQDFSISLGRADSGLHPRPDAAAAAGTNERSKLALQSCVAADAHAYKQGMDLHRIKHRPISVTIPPICAT